MSFNEKITGRTFTPGWFLADNENCDRKTRQMSQAKATSIGGAKIVPMGTVWPSNDTNAVGIVYEDIDVTTGDMPGSVVLSGSVYEDRLPVALDSAAKTALEAKGFNFIAKSPAVTRPY